MSLVAFGLDYIQVTKATFVIFSSFKVTLILLRYLPLKKRNNRYVLSTSSNIFSSFMLKGMSEVSW